MLPRPHDDRPQRIESLLLKLVRAARDDDAPARGSRRAVTKAAVRRRGRSAAISGLAGPLAPVALQVAELHAEACTVCDLDRLHDLRLSDRQIAAHLLVLWSVTDRHEAAVEAMEHGDETVAALLRARLREAVAGAALPEGLTMRSLAAALWRVRGAARRGVPRGPAAVVGSVVRPGPATKTFIRRAEQQLGVG